MFMPTPTRPGYRGSLNMLFIEHGGGPCCPPALVQRSDQTSHGKLAASLSPAPSSGRRVNMVCRVAVLTLAVCAVDGIQHCNGCQRRPRRARV